MAQIETAEGQTLIVENKATNPQLRFKARLKDADGFSRSVDDTVFSVYSDSANRHSDLRPRSRGDLTAESMEDFANRLIGWAVNEGVADRRGDITIEQITIYEQDSASQARRAYVPDWDDDWPEDGSQSDKVRFMLNYESNFTDENIAVAVGCSRSLVSDVKKKLNED